jgi:Flp pilus assembly protein TadD
MRLGAAAAPLAQSSDQSAATATASPSAPELSQANSLLESGKAADADRAVRSFLQSHPDSADAHFLLGLILFREIQLHGADVSTLSYPAEASDAKFRQSKAKESLAEFTEGARHQIPSAFDLKIVSFDYILLGDYTDADKWLTRATHMDPADADTWYNLGRTKYSENRFDEAIQTFQHCLLLDPKNVKAENNLGLSYEGLGRKDDAIAAYKQAIAWDSHSPHKSQEPYLNLGSLLVDQDQAKDALPYLLQAETLAPEDAKVHERLGKAYAHLNQLPQAQSELEKAVALAPYVASLHFMLGQVYRREGLMQKAKAEMKRTDELNGTHSSGAAPQP